jgi:hypothetical protein
LIAILRNPVERLYSHYIHNEINGLGKRNGLKLEQALRVMPYFKGMGLYFKQLTDFLEWFPRNQLKIVLLDDLKQDPVGLMRSLCMFLEIDPAFQFHVSVIGNNQVPEGAVFPPMSAKMKKDLQKYYQEDVDQLSRLLGRDLSAWLAPK